MQNRIIYLHLAAVAQLVEQRTENPCVVGSIPTGGKARVRNDSGFFFMRLLVSPYSAKIIFFTLVPNLLMAYNSTYEMVDCCFWWKKRRC